MSTLKACFPQATVPDVDDPFLECDSARTPAAATCPPVIRSIFPDPSIIAKLYVENQCNHPQYPDQAAVFFLDSQFQTKGVILFQNGCIEATAKPGQPTEERVCSMPQEDCSHTRCCRDPGSKCYKKDSLFATCLPSCLKSLHWSCDIIDDENLDCAEDSEDCVHVGCCKSKDHQCFMKTPGLAFCRTSAPHDWLGFVITAKVPTGDGAQEPTPVPQPAPRPAPAPQPRPSPSPWPPAPPPPTPTTTTDSGLPMRAGDHHEDLSQGWEYGMHGTHYWDCSGQGCDAAYLQPWVQEKYVSPPQYAPMNPHNHGGPVYGEHIWMTGAASDAVSQKLGPDVNHCGADNGGGGGCGQCLLVKTAQSNHPDWTVIIMKKNRCPPASNGCGGGEFHMDFAVPGYDNLQYSLANICGNPHTTLSKQQSAVCTGSQPSQCNCAAIPSHTPALKRMRDGCELFKSWGWQTGTPILNWRPVPCPHHFVEQVKIGAAFGSQGPTMELFETGHGSNATALRAGGGPMQLPMEGAKVLPWVAEAVLAGALVLMAAYGLGRRLRAASQRGMSLAAAEVLVQSNLELVE